jgi:hypothetical protein
MEYDISTTDDMKWEGYNLWRVSDGHGGSFVSRRSGALS